MVRFRSFVFQRTANENVNAREYDRTEKNCVNFCYLTAIVGQFWLRVVFAGNEKLNGGRLVVVRHCA